MTIAVYGGTFDPIHTGHAIVANYISQYGGVDEVWLTVSRLNPFKVASEPAASDRERLEMATLVADGCERVKICDIELGMAYPSYSYTTLRELQRRYPQHRFKLVIGADNWPCFAQWRNPDEIIRDFGLLVYPRPGWDLSSLTFPDNVRYLADAPVLEVSSTFIRQQIKNGANMRYFVPSAVYDYIRTHRLYE